MISRIHGRLVRRDIGSIEVLTPGGVAYELEIPLGVFERLPAEGAELELRTVQVVREDAVTLYGFLDVAERSIFAKLLTASGVGPKLALSILSSLPPERIVRAILEKDIVTLRRIPGLGTKKAERLVLGSAAFFNPSADRVVNQRGVVLTEGLVEISRPLRLHIAQTNSILRPLGPSERRLDGGKVERQFIGVRDRRAVVPP